MEVREHISGKFLKLYLHAGEFYNILNTKIDTMKVLEVFCLSTYAAKPDPRLLSD
jgi:hypothetical protein